MKLARFVPVLLLALVVAACGQDPIILPDAVTPPAPALELSPPPESSDDEDPGAPHHSGDPVCEGEWVPEIAPDGTTRLICLSPHTGSGT
jgi:hypothetical protein